MCLIKGCICWWTESSCYQNAQYNNKNYIGIFYGQCVYWGSS